MRTLLIGIDSGTQSTKALVVDARDGKVLGRGGPGYDLIPGLPPGAKEQHPRAWLGATAKAIKAALRQAKPTPGKSSPSASADSNTASCRWTRPARSSARPSFGATPRPPPSAMKSPRNWAG